MKKAKVFIGATVVMAIVAGTVAAKVKKTSIETCTINSTIAQACSVQNLDTDPTFNGTVNFLYKQAPDGVACSTLTCDQQGTALQPNE